MVRNNNFKTVALIQGGLGAEREISLISAQAVAKVLDVLNISYTLVDADKDLATTLIKLQPDCAFLAIHGKYAEDGLVQALCEYLHIPYTGSGVMASAVCMNKCFFKNYIHRCSLPTPKYQILNLKEKSKIKESDVHLSLPVVIKPGREGSSIGVSICRRSEELIPALQKANKYDTQVLVEEYIEGMELACSFLNGKVLSPVEICPKSGFYNYKNKYTSGATEYILPSRLPQEVIEQCKKITFEAQQLLDIRSYCRADFILQNNKVPLLLEVNTLPGLTELSLLPKSAQYDGIDFVNLIQQIIQGAALDYEGLC